MSSQAMDLAELQREMAAAVMLPLTADEQMRSQSADGRQMNAVAESFIAPNSRLSAFERLEIYNRQYWFRVMGALAEDYAALRAVVGNGRFEALSVAYLKEHPSRSFTLRNLGSKLPEWLAVHGEWAGRRQRLAVANREAVGAVVAFQQVAGAFGLFVDDDALGGELVEHRFGGAPFACFEVLPPLAFFQRRLIRHAQGHPLVVVAVEPPQNGFGFVRGAQPRLGSFLRFAHRAAVVRPGHAACQPGRSCAPVASARFCTTLTMVLDRLQLITFL